MIPIPRFLVLALLLPATALAWTPGADQRIAKKSIQLAPPDLRFMIEKYKSEYDRGLASAAEQSTTPSKEGTAAIRSAIEKNVGESISLLRDKSSPADFVRNLGILVHLVSIANDPLHLDPAASLEGKHADYESYFEKRMTRFPTVFYGLDSKLQLSAYLDRMLSRTSRFCPLLEEEYFRFGEDHISTEFDDRSTAFGIASVTYSHSVTDAVNLYYFIWREIGGDVRTASALQKGNLLINAAESR
jgi:hypothetical protein